MGRASNPIREYIATIERRLLDAAMLGPLQPLVVSRNDYERMLDAGVLRVCGERRDDGSAFCAGQVGHDGPHEWARGDAVSRHGRVFDRRLPRVNPIKPPRDTQWPPPGVRDIGPRQHQEKPVQFNKPRVKR